MGNDCLYRYRVGNKYDISNLLENKIWLTNPTQFNDPYDCAIQLNFYNAVEKNIYYTLLEQYGDKLPVKIIKQLSHYECDLLHNIDNEDLRINVHFREMIKHVGVACFTLQNNDISMWGYYSNSHSGFCLEYKVEDLKKLGSLNKVTYADEFDNLYDLIIDSSRDIDKVIRSYITLKSTFWRHENEVRLVKFDNEIPEGHKGILIDSPIPSAIYLGCKISEEMREILVFIARIHGIRVFEMHMNKTEFCLFSTEII